MATVVPDEALEWFAEKSLNEAARVDEKIYDVGVGSGSSGVSSSDTQLDSQEFRGNSDDSVIAIVENDPETGEIQVTITLNGGTEVPADTEITEIGVWARDPALPDSNFENGNETTNDADDYMIYRELRPGIILSSGDQKTFQFTIDITQA